MIPWKGLLLLWGVLCSADNFDEFTRDVTKLLEIYELEQHESKRKMNDVLEKLGDITINSDTSHEVLEEIMDKLDAVMVNVSLVYEYCKESEDTMGAFVEAVKTDECTDGLPPPGEGFPVCPAHSSCVDVLVGYECRCNDGYSGRRTCKDVDECSQNKDNCDSNADCTNTQGSFTCQCKLGYHGDGTTCRAKDTCSSGRQCRPNAFCKNGYCYCNPGYTGDGHTCADVDECQQEDAFECHAKANCQNTVGSYRCNCIEGFQGNGKACSDVNECRGKNDCSSAARCANIYGSYICSCLPGYTGDGYECQDVDECADEDLYECDPNASCQNIPGHYLCNCNQGYEGIGKHCQDVDECSLPSSPCHSNAICNNVDGSFSCSCNRGYSGDGYHCQDLCPLTRVQDVGCVQVESQTYKSWDDATEHCRSLGGQLFVAGTPEHFVKLRQYFMNEKSNEFPDWNGPWVGVKNQEWLDGRNVNSDEWAESMCHFPVDCCGSSFSGESNFRIHNTPCETSRPYICQWFGASS